MNISKNEQAILRYIREFPGAHFRRIVRELGLSHGPLTYYISKLEKKELIIHRREGCKKCFFPTGYVYKPIEHTSRQQKVLSIIEENPRIPDEGIAAILGITRQAVNYHTRKLSKQGSIISIKENRKKLWYVSDESDL